MKTVNARKTVDSIVRNRKDILKHAALQVAVSDGQPWCDGAENTVFVTIHADWLGAYTIRCDHDGEVWTVTIHGGHRVSKARTVNEFDEMVDAMRVVNAIADKIDSSLF
jgi:hypothetical protein